MIRIELHARTHKVALMWGWHFSSFLTSPRILFLIMLHEVVMLLGGWEWRFAHNLACTSEKVRSEHLLHRATVYAELDAVFQSITLLPTASFVIKLHRM